MSPELCVHLNPIQRLATWTKNLNFSLSLLIIAYTHIFYTTILGLLSEIRCKIILFKCNFLCHIKQQQSLLITYNSTMLIVPEKKNYNESSRHNITRIIVDKYNIIPSRKNASVDYFSYNSWNVAYINYCLVTSVIVN